MRPLTCLLLSIVALGCGPSGPQWEKSNSNTKEQLNALFGFGANDVWAAGENGAVVHFNGTTWTSVPSGTSRALNAIWGAAPNDVWFVGDSGAVLRWNGSTISPVAGAAPLEFVGVRGSSTSAVFVCASAGLFFFDGTFHEFTRGTARVPCHALFSLGGTTVGALVDKSDSSSAMQVQTLTSGGGTVLADDIRAFDPQLVAVSPTDLWVLGQTAKSISRVGSGAPRELVLPKDMSAGAGWANGPNDVWLGGSSGMIAHFDGTELTLSAAGEYSAPQIRALWGTTGLTWAAGDDGWLLRRIE